VKYLLNIVIVSEGTDSLVAVYCGKRELKRNWRKDAVDFLVENGVNPEGDAEWYCYFQAEDKNGDLTEMSYRELFERSRSVKFYWTDSITGKGSYVYAEKEKAEGILQKYFEASAVPLPGVEYPETAAPWAGTIVPKWIAEGAA
jgi:hypothetical protein